MFRYTSPNFTPGMMTLNPSVRVVLFVVVATWMCGTGCTKKDAKPGNLRPLSFTLNEQLLSSPCYDTSLGISYKVPMGWEPVARALIDSALHTSVAGRGGAPGAIVNARAVFRDPLSDATLLVIAADSMGGLNPSGMVQGYASFYRSSDSLANVQTDSFMREPFRVHQLMVAGRSTVVFKMIFDRPESPMPSFEFNFAVPRGDYPSSARAIESVIASIQTHLSN